MIKKILTTAALGMVLAACSQIPKQAYYNRGSPESLLDVSSEVVNFRIQSPASVQEITNWINKDQPTRAELHCQDGDPLCGEVQSVLHQFRVPVKFASNSADNVALVYERVAARDCENRYIDNMINPYNLNHPTFGCSNAANMVQMVSDKRQFTNPSLTGYADGIKTEQAVEFYAKPAAFAAPKLDSAFQPIATQSVLQTNGLTGGSTR